MTIARLAYIALTGLVLACSASLVHADQVSCGNSSLGLRLTVIDPGLTGGYCYAQVGNLQNADITALGLTQIDRNGNAIDIINHSINAGTGGTSGTWSFPLAQWEGWGRLFLGFHFGNASGVGSAADPDSFIIELDRADTSGTWALTGTGAVLRAFSNIYLIGDERGSFCATCPRNTTPEPSPLALLGLMLVAPLIWRRRLR